MMGSRAAVQADNPFMAEVASAGVHILMMPTWLELALPPMDALR